MCMYVALRVLLLFFFFFLKVLQLVRHISKGEKNQNKIVMLIKAVRTKRKER